MLQKERYIYSKGSSNKFWEIHFDNEIYGKHEVTIKHGKVGKKGTTLVTELTLNQVAKRIEEKEFKGYEFQGTAKEKSQSIINKFPSEKEESIKEKSVSVKITKKKCTKNNPEPPCNDGFEIRRNSKGYDCCFKQTKKSRKYKEYTINADVTPYPGINVAKEIRDIINDKTGGIYLSDAGWKIVGNATYDDNVVTFKVYGDIRTIDDIVGVNGLQDDENVISEYTELWSGSQIGYNNVTVLDSSGNIVYTNKVKSKSSSSTKRQPYYNLTYEEGRSNKFYNMELMENNSVNIHYGRKYTRGRIMNKAFKTREEALDFMEQQVETKFNSGYNIIESYVKDTYRKQKKTKKNSSSTNIFRV